MQSQSDKSRLKNTEDAVEEVFGGGAFGKKLVGGAFAAAGLMLINSQLQKAEQNVQKWADGIREVEANITTVAQRSEAMNAGLLKNADAIKQMQAESEKAAEPGLFSRGWAEFKNLLNVTQNMIEDGIARDIQGREVLTAEQLRQQKEDQKRVAARIKEESAFINSLREEANAIGKTSQEAKLYQLQLKGMADADARMAQAMIARNERMKEQAERQKKLTDGVKAYAEELQKSLATIGMSESEKKLFELENLGASKERLAILKEQANTLEAMQAAISLIPKNPLDNLNQQLTGLNELLERGKITANEFKEANARARKDFLDKKLQTQSLPQNLVRGTAAELSFRNQQSKRQKEEIILEKQLKEQEQIKALQKEQVNAARDLVSAIRDASGVIILGL